ncbi:MAG: hypothetical protein LBJ89_03420 [Holosporales bacterium]|jgi:hypothetical protein|nr:hypothetical protein [Holosporales bacterium]
MLTKKILKKGLTSLVLTAVHLSASVLKTPVLEDDVRCIGGTLLIGKKNQALTANVYQYCRNAFSADDASRADAVGNLLRNVPEFPLDYDTMSDIFQIMFANPELLGEYIQFLPHFIFEAGDLAFCMKQPVLKNQLTKIGFSLDITRAKAHEAFAKIGYCPVNETYLSLLSKLLSFGAEYEYVRNACKDLLNAGRNTPRNASASVEHLLAVIPENCASYGNLFVLLRNLSLDQSHFMERFDLLKAEIDKTENRAKLLTSILLKLASKSKSDQFYAAVTNCLKTKAESTASGIPPAAHEDALNGRIKTLIDLFPQFPPERTALTRCMFDVCDNSDTFYSKLHQLQQTMAGTVDQSILLARAFTRFDDVVAAMDDCLKTGSPAALSKICFTQPRRPDTILSLCVKNDMNGLISALHGPEPTSDELIADIVSRVICNDLRSTIVNSLAACKSAGLVKLDDSLLTMQGSINTALQGIVPQTVRSFLFVDDSELKTNMSTAMQHLGF